MIPESQHLEALRIQPESPFFVLFALQRMLPPIGFNNQCLFVADEINNKATNLLLPTELQAIELLRPEMPSQ